MGNEAIVTWLSRLPQSAPSLVRGSGACPQAKVHGEEGSGEVRLRALGWRTIRFFTDKGQRRSDGRRQAGSFAWYSPQMAKGIRMDLAPMTCAATFLHWPIGVTLSHRPAGPIRPSADSPDFQGQPASCRYRLAKDESRRSVHKCTSPRCRAANTAWVRSVT